MNTIINFLCVLGEICFNKQKQETTTIEKPKEVNFMVTVEEIREKIKYSGWRLLEMPVRSGDSISGWKIVVAKGEKSITIEGTTLLLAMQRTGQYLGVWRP